MRTVWKFSADMADTVSMSMPVGARILHVGVQGEGPNTQLCVWALVRLPERRDKAITYESREFRIAGTGHPVDDLGINEDRYIGTIQLHEGFGQELVFHIWEVT